jgi:hypothetical protein
MPRAQSRLTTWASSVNGRHDDGLLDDVRRALDDDLDTPGALVLIDAAVSRGCSARDSAALLGIVL